MCAHPLSLLTALPSLSSHQGRHTSQGERRRGGKAHHHPLISGGLLGRVPHDPGHHAERGQRDQDVSVADAKEKLAPCCTFQISLGVGPAVICGPRPAGTPLQPGGREWSHRHSRQRVRRRRARNPSETGRPTHVTAS